MPKRPTRPTQCPSPQWARARQRWKPRHSCRGGCPLDSYAFTAHKRYGKKGRPTPGTPIKATEWQIEAQVPPDAERINHAKQLGACYVIGSNIPLEQLSDVEVITGYKAQAQAEGGFRFLKDPLFFVSSLFVKKPSRIQGLL